MANVVKLGSLLLDGVHTAPGSVYQPGKAISFSNGNDLQWVVVNGLLIASHPFLVNVSWDDLDRQNLVHENLIRLNGLRFLCRLIMVGAKENDTNEWDAALDVLGDDNELWHWREAAFWGQENPNSSFSLRGLTSARFRRCARSSFSNEFYGYRPAMEPVASKALVPGSKICAIGGQTLLYGTLLETTGYDVLMQTEQSSLPAPADAGELYSALQDGTVAINRSLMTVQAVEEV